MNGEIKMKINQEKLNNYLQTIHGSICPLCGNNNWTISDQVFQAIEFDYKGILINGASYPMVPLTCTTCGNTYFINALVAGLIDKEVPQSPNMPEKDSNPANEK
jgi:predicted nucleic-acid-binding Zn-ribbon protein